MSAISTTASFNFTADNHGLSLPTLDGQRSNRLSKSFIFPRVVVMEDEDSRECPSQEACEIAREDLFLQGVDERRGQGQGFSRQQTTSPRMLQYRPFSHHRALGLRRHGSFRERRDSNSFDSYDSDSDDSTTHSALLPFHHEKKHLQKPNLPTPTFILVNTGKVQTQTAFDINSRNKRKTPSPVVGEEPAPVSVAPMTDDSMDTSEDGTLETQETCDTTEAGYDSGDNMLPSPGRRLSLDLTPVSRRLAIQFDSISFLSPAKPSRAKRRKTFDTSATCLNGR